MPASHLKLYRGPEESAGPKLAKNPSGKACVTGLSSMDSPAANPPPRSVAMRRSMRSRNEDFIV